MFFVSRCLWTCLWTCLFFRFFVAVPTKLTVRGSQLFAWEENGVSFRISLHRFGMAFTPFRTLRDVRFIMFYQFYHWFIIVLFVLLLYVLSCLYVSVKFPDHRRSPVWSVPYSHELLQRSLQTSKCRFFLRWCWAASQGVNPWRQRLALSALSARTWCRHDQFPTYQHWANMIQHGRPFRSSKFGFSSYWK